MQEQSYFHNLFAVLHYSGQHLYQTYTHTIYVGMFHLQEVGTGASALQLIH